MTTEVKPINGIMGCAIDTTVASGSAQYTWNGTDWDKVAEEESMDIDFTAMLAPYHKVSDTVDVLVDGTTKVVMTAQERADLADLKTDAIRFSDTLWIQGPTASELAGYTVA